MLDPFVLLAPLLLLPVVGLLRFIGCTSFTEAAADVKITIDPTTVDLGPGESKQFTANADGVPTTAVTWSPNAPNGLYKAADPRNPSATTDTITATSTATVSATGSATVNLKAVTVVVTPPLVSLKAGEKQQFTAKVQPTPDQSVTWTNAVNGLFTAPSPYVMGSAPVTITASANADPSAKGTAIVNLIGSGAQFVSTDVVTRGNWSGVYGSKGWALAATPANLVKNPAFVSLLNPPAAPVFRFADPTPDPRGLQRPPMFLDRIAYAWYDPTSVQFEIEFTDFQTHRVALYCVDWDLQARTQRVDILSSATPPVVLATRTLSGFDGGQYLICDVAGKVILRATKIAGPNALIFGIFFD